MSAGYEFEVACGNCGGELRPLAQGRPIAGTEASAVAKCARCGWEWQVIVHLRSAANLDTKQRRYYERQKAGVG